VSEALIRTPLIGTMFYYIDKKRLLYAVEMANIRDFVESLPLKYNTKIGNT
jgi:ABC-type bacteriocin/lantibiotic exporter with double-glycine peptidase domain